MKKNKKLIILGVGDFSEVVYEYFNYQSEYKVVAFSVEKNLLNIEKFLGLPVVAVEDLNSNYNTEEYEVFVAVGYRNLNKLRARLVKIITQYGYTLASFIHKSAIISETAIIEGHCIILENSIIQPFAKIGFNTIIWCGAIISHHVSIGKNCFLAPGVAISGFSKIGDNSFLGIRSTIIDSITIGQSCIIGAGTLILRDIKENTVVTGINSKNKSGDELSNKNKSIFY
ncbi:acetyltransferase [Clostridium gasigenes]|uniref:acetyltransferase n=1 Tax=Clostridium gasigenes TaxID=94869 RepID=UPI001C0E4CB5|nr:acetyltransferase [Clostridium gasigenes]MBU3107646.1 acetyltransferase [Clostridium gasigenes]